MTYHSPPKVPGGFPELRRVKPKTPLRGGGGLRARWKDADGNLYEWDSRHGTVEKYDKRGNHLGEFDSDSGEQVKGSEAGRTVLSSRRERLMWILRQYSIEDDELLGEVRLEGWRLEDAERLLGFAPTKLGSTPVDHAAASELMEDGAPLVIEKNSAFFLDFDAEPEAVERTGAPDTAVTS